MLTDVGIHTVRLKTLLEKYVSGEIVPYENNRGCTDLTKLGQIFNNFHAHSFGMVALSPYQGKLRICDGHRRFKALCIGSTEVKTIREKLLEAEVGVEVVPENKFLEVYIERGCQQPHTTKQDVLNRDMKYGQFILNQLVPTLVRTGGFDPKFLIGMFEGPRALQLAYVVYALDRNLRKWEYQKVFAIRKHSSREFCYAAAGKHLIRLPDATFVRLVSAIEYYIAYHRELITLSKSKRVTSGGVQNKGSWFGLIITDHLAPQKHIPADPKLLAARTISNIPKVKDWLVTLGGGNSTRIAQSEDGLWKTLKFTEAIRWTPTLVKRAVTA
jgi:hypothetical protein